MIEIPEAHNLSKQLKCLFQKKIISTTAAHTPHKFAWYSGDPDNYAALLNGKRITSAEPVGGMVKIEAEDVAVVLSDGINLNYYENEQRIPQKHQLLITFEDKSILCASVQMYGGLLCSPEDELDNKYYLIAKEKPSPLSEDFNETYFDMIISDPGLQKLSLKAILATEQRIPGLGNGVLQDILFFAGAHPKKKVSTLSAAEKKNMFEALRSTLLDMAEKGGRDTEKDLFGNSGGYKTLCSKKTAGKPCPKCGSLIQKSSYMGGSVYYCGKCQVL
jgi:formamidopyrimidine-DNA glycosylase